MLLACRGLNVKREGGFIMLHCNFSNCVACALCVVCCTLQTVQALLPSAASGEGGDKLQAEALQWGQQQGMSVRSAATFARCFGG